MDTLTIDIPFPTEKRTLDMRMIAIVRGVSNTEGVTEVEFTDIGLKVTGVTSADWKAIISIVKTGIDASMEVIEKGERGLLPSKKELRA